MMTKRVTKLQRIHLKKYILQSMLLSYFSFSFTCFTFVIRLITGSLISFTCFVVPNLHLILIEFKYRQGLLVTIRCYVCINCETIAKKTLELQLFDLTDLFYDPFYELPNSSFICLLQKIRIF
jgi:hypothetical protein